MKRLLIAIAAAATTMFASAAVLQQAGFEGTTLDGGFTGSGGTPTLYEEEPSVNAYYPLEDGFGLKYCAIDADDADQLQSATVASGAVFDMVVSFTNLEEAPETAPDGSKLALYRNASGKLVVLAWPVVDGKPTAYETDAEPGDWSRLTIVPVSTGNDTYEYKVYCDDSEPVKINKKEATFQGLASGAATRVSFTGSGKLDNFVARTTNPFYSGEYAASTGADNEKYATYSDALADVLSAGATDAIKIAGETPRIVNGTAANPYEITNLADLQALADAVNAGNTCSGKCFVQTANIDMVNTDPFAGVGVYGDAALTHANARPFMGTYDGAGYKISNITFTDRDYAGVFNRVDGGTIKNLTIEDVGYVGTGSKYCASIVGYALNGATLENLVSAGTFGSSDKPGAHNMAGIVVRVSGGTDGDGTQILNCTNNATIYGGYTKLAGICAISQEKIAAENNPKMVFSGCANNGELILNRNSNGITGLAGIVGYSDVDTVMTDCSNTGAITQQGTGYNTDCTGALIGQTYGHSITDGGNNSAPANMKMIGKWAGATETGFLYATVDNGVATTVTTLAKDTTYLLEGSVAASETPVFTFAEAGTIAFDAALGYTFAGTVTVANSNLLDLTDATKGTVKTYTADGGTAVASITKDEATTQYNTVAKALAAAKSGDTVVLLADNTVAITIPAGVTVDCGEFANTGAIDGAGAIKLNAKPAEALAFDASWTGTAKICWDPGNTRFVFSEFGNENSKVEIIGANGAFSAFPCTAWTGGNVPSDTLPGLVLSANWTVNEGYKNSTTTFASLSGTGNLTVQGTSSGAEPITYAFNTVADFTGTLGGGVRTRGTFKIVDIQNNEAGFGDCLVKLDAKAQTKDLAQTKVGGEAATLAVGTVGDQKGIYLARASVVVNDEVVPYVTVAEAITAANTAKVSSVTVYDGSSTAVKGWSYDNGVYSRCIAKVGEDPYTTLEAAIAAANAGETKTVELLYTCGESVTIPAGVTVNSLTTANDFHGTIAGAGTLYYAQKPSAQPTFDSTWAGTCVIGWTHEGPGALNLNDYGNAKSTVKIAADVTGGYIGNGGSTEADKTYTIAPAIELAANVKLTSGWGTGTKNGYLTTFPMLKGGNDKTLTLWGTAYSNLKTYYKFTALDGFGGTIAINTRAYATIETIKVAQTPAVGAKVANITIAKDGTLEDPSSITVKVGDEVQDVTLEFKADGAEGSGLYVAEPPVEIDPSDVVINYNCYATLSVTGYPEGATFGWTMYTNNVACKSTQGPVKISSGKTTATVKVYSETTAIDGVVARVAITNGGEVIEREATITVADVAAKIGETEYTKAQLDNAIAAAIESGDVLEHYVSVSTTISKGQTLKTKKLAERNGTASVKAAASTTAGEAWTIAKTEEDGVITWSVGTETAYFEFTSADSQTVEYLASPKNAAGVNKLLSDATITKQFSVTKDGVVLDLNGHALTSTYASASAGAFYVNVISPAPAALTVKDSVGGGSIAAASAHSVFMLGSNGQLTVEGGSFTGKHIVYGSKTTSAATITGGTFTATDAGFTLNMLDSARGTITVTGGTFTGFNPANNSAEGAGTNFVPNGYVSTETSTGVWTVSKSAGGFPGGEDGKTFTIDTAVQAALADKIPEGKALTDAVAGTTSGVTYAQAYALGLLDEETGDVEKDVTPTIEVKNGKVVVSLDATAKAGYKVMLNVYQKTSLTENWPVEPTKRYELKSAEAAGFEPSNVGAGFYKVGVTIEDAE